MAITTPANKVLNRDDLGRLLGLLTSRGVLEQAVAKHILAIFDNGAQSVPDLTMFLSGLARTEDTWPEVQKVLATLAPTPTDGGGTGDLPLVIPGGPQKPEPVTIPPVQKVPTVKPGPTGPGLNPEDETVFQRLVAFRDFINQQYPGSSGLYRGFLERRFEPLQSLFDIQARIQDALAGVGPGQGLSLQRFKDFLPGNLGAGRQAFTNLAQSLSGLLQGQGPEVDPISREFFTKPGPEGGLSLQEDIGREASLFGVNAFARDFRDFVFKRSREEFLGRPEAGRGEFLPQFMQRFPQFFR